MKGQYFAKQSKPRNDYFHAVHFYLLWILFLAVVYATRMHILLTAFSLLRET